MRSDNITKGVGRAPNRSLLYALGYTQEELDRVLRELEKLGLDGYVQELAAADTAYIPAFNGEGVEL